jgi:hypothetical protein
MDPRRTYGAAHLAKLAEYLAAAGIAAISRESIRQILRDAGIRWLATKTWKASTGPRFIERCTVSWTFTPIRRLMGG